MGEQLASSTQQSKREGLLPTEPPGQKVAPESEGRPLHEGQQYWLLKLAAAAQQALLIQTGLVTPEPQQCQLPEPS